MPYCKCAILLLLLVLVSCANQNELARLKNIKWIHGSANCKNNIDPPVQVVQYNSNTWILRQNKCLNYEAPFMFLLMGDATALLMDTGATSDSIAFPLYRVVDSLLHGSYGDKYSNIELVVAHTHSHNDHYAADSQFISKSRTKVVGLTLPEVKSFFNISGWPNQIQTYDLGKRVIDLIPIPGHDDTSLAFYDRNTGLLFSGDTFYPGRLYVRDWKSFSNSIQRLVDFSTSHDVTGFIGNHLEMTKMAGKDYPVETIYQPEEHELVLSTNNLLELNEVIRKLGDTVKRVVRNDFIIYPVNEQLPPETDINEKSLFTMTIDGYPDFLKADADGVWVTNNGRVEKLKVGMDRPLLSVKIPQPCGVMANGFGSLWVADCKNESVCRADLKTGKVLAVIKTGLADKDGELSIAASRDAIWLLTKMEGELSRIDPKTNIVTDRIKILPYSYAVAYDFGSLWVTNTKDASVQQIDPEMKKVISTIAVGREPRFLATGLGAIWTLNQEDGTVSKIDPTNQVATTINVGVKGSGGDITVGSKYVYVRAKKTLLSVIDPQSDKVISRFGPVAGSGAVAVENGHVWVTAHDINKVWVIKE